MFPFSRSSSEPSHHENSHPSAIPAEAGVHRPSVSLSEAFLDSSSRTRDSLPEQYRTQFDELRSDILAFCHDFNIPVETLRSKEAFGAELTSKRIPTERMREVVSLFARLEYLVTNREPFKEIPSEYLEEAERLYHLREQYNTQVSFLERIGILKEGAITGIDGKNYPIPTLEQIATHLFERREVLSTKHDQGFTKLLLVPFGMSLDALQETLKQFLLFYRQTHPTFDLDITQPLWTWEDGYKGADTGNPPKIVYYPKRFDGKNHQGQTKTEILEEQAVTPGSFPGWRIHLLQAPKDNLPGFRGIPRQGQGKTQGEDSPRPDLEANKTPTEYLSLLQQAQDNPDSPYFQESGLTPEDWILAFVTHLTETGQPLDDYGSDKEGATYLTGAFFPSDDSSLVSCAYWRRDDRRARLRGDDPRVRGGAFGVHSSVIV